MIAISSSGGSTKTKPKMVASVQDAAYFYVNDFNNSANCMPEFWPTFWVEGAFTLLFVFIQTPCECSFQVLRNPFVSDLCSSGFDRKKWTPKGIFLRIITTRGFIKLFFTPNYRFNLAVSCRCHFYHLYQQPLWLFVIDPNSESKDLGKNTSSWTIIKTSWYRSNAPTS